MKRIILLIILFVSFATAYSQVDEKLSPEEKARREKNIQAGNPFKKYGYYPKIATLSKGKYLEFHDLDTIVRIGSFTFNTNTMKIVGYNRIDESDDESMPRPDLISRWFSPDPLSEEFPSWSPYNYANCNPIKFIDPDGRAAMPPDDYIFNENGDFVRVERNNLPDRLVIENSQTGLRDYYVFADPVNDPKDIDNGIINKVVFVSNNEIRSMLHEQGAFNSSYYNFYKESKGGGDFDYSYSVIPKKYGNLGASASPLSKPSSLLFIPEGDYTAHNHMNFGNFLWGATGYSVGFEYSTLQLGAHYNSLANPGDNKYASQLDSSDDQRSIILGAYYAQKHNYRHYNLLSSTLNENNNEPPKR